MSVIYFSLQEANELIQEIKPEVDKLIQLRDELELLDNTKIEFDQESLENLLLEVELNRTFHEKNLEMYAIIGSLIKSGFVIRDLYNLELYLYSRFEDKDILFCWKPGEEKITHWAEPGRQAKEKRSISVIEKSYFQKLKELR